MERDLHWPNCYNVRDLGGLPLTQGGMTQMGRLVRADTLCRLDDKGIEMMIAYGIRTVIDLRAPHEIANDPSPIKTLGWEGRYVNRPLERFYPHVGEMIRKAKSRAEVYCIITDHYPDMIAAAMRTIRAGSRAGVLFHCHAGQDRTGHIAGLLLKLAGVSNEVIADDYAQSQKNLMHLYTAHQLDPLDETLSFWARPTATKDMMLLLLDHIDKKYGGVTDYLTFAGLQAGEIKSLRSLLLETK